MVLLQKLPGEQYGGPDDVMRAYGQVKRAPGRHAERRVNRQPASPHARTTTRECATAYYHWWAADGPHGAPTVAWDEASGVRAVQQRYPGDWAAIPEDFALVADERRLEWEDERARSAGDVPVAELLRVF
jgi:hypothetical protein